jgi:hypothetical protein
MASTLYGRFIVAEKGYNGWTNYETWALALWIGNEEGSYKLWRERTREALDPNRTTVRKGFTRNEEAALILADELKAETEDNAPDLGASFYADVMNAALAEVHWYQIALRWVEEEAEEMERQGTAEAD